MSRIPNAVFSGCSVANGGTLGPADLQVGGPYDGFYRVLIQAEPVEFAQPLTGGHTPFGETVTWEHGEINDWPIEMSCRVLSREGDFPSVEVDHGPLGEELIATWQLMINPAQGENFIWNPGRSAIDVNNAAGAMLRYSYGGDYADMGGSIDWVNPDRVGMRGGLKHVADAPDPRYVPGAPFQAFPGNIGGFGYDRFGILREEFTTDGSYIDTTAGLIGVAEGFVGDIIYLPSDADAPQTWVFSVWRACLQSGPNPSLRKLNSYPVEYVVHLPTGSGDGGDSPGAPRRDEMTQWTTLHHAATNRVRTKLFNTLAVWQGDRLKDLTEIGSSANSSIDGGVTFDAVEGETYMIQVGTGDPGVNGAAVLTWEPTP